MSGRRATSLGPTEMFLLRQWGTAIGEAWRAQPYLVGSVMRGEAWRDVDVRLMLADDRFEAMFGTKPWDPHTPSILSASNVAYTVWGQRATGLPIDFQFQSMTEGNGLADKTPRNPLWVTRRALVGDPEPGGEA